MLYQNNPFCRNAARITKPQLFKHEYEAVSETLDRGRCKMPGHIIHQAYNWRIAGDGAGVGHFDFEITFTHGQGRLQLSITSTISMSCERNDRESHSSRLELGGTTDRAGRNYLSRLTTRLSSRAETNYGKERDVSEMKLLMKKGTVRGSHMEWDSARISTQFPFVSHNTFHPWMVAIFPLFSPAPWDNPSFTCTWLIDQTLKYIRNSIETKKWIE